MSGKLVGEYELLGPLGEGTVGSTFRARHVDTNQPAAIKLLKAEASKDPDIQRRFVREVAIVEKLDHENIVRHYDCGLRENQIYFAMELVDGGTLKDVLLRQHTLPWREAVQCAKQICSALQHASENGIIHRDLKPTNLFLSSDGLIKVGDFGLARDLDNTRLTLEGQTVGTCRYMPPEQVTGDDELTGAVDLYALGCILFEMLIGRPPFDGDTIISIFEQHMNSKPPCPKVLAPDIPDDLSRLILLLLEKEPKDRPAGATATRCALSDILNDRPMELLAPQADGEESVDRLPDGLNLTERLQTLPKEDSKTTLVWIGIAAAIVCAGLIWAVS